MTEAFKTLTDARKLAARNDSILTIAEKVADIEAAHAQNKTALILGFQAPKPIDDDPSLLEGFHRMGIRICGLSYQRRNYFANGSGEDKDNGLGMLGFELVRTMNDLGVVIDLSHVGDTSSLDAIEASEHPVIISHSNARALCNHFRNATDEMIRAMAKKGGVIGIGALSMYLREDGPKVGTTFKDAVRHMAYVAELVGIDHVGIGTDAAPESRKMGDLQAMDSRYPEFKFSTEGPIEKRYAFQKITDMPKLTDQLVAHGFSDEDIAKILGGNMMRVFRKIWGG
jgi:microsomal dipeptidase-like Zn-dependent dipeptidase